MVKSVKDTNSFKTYSGQRWGKESNLSLENSLTSSTSQLIDWPITGQPGVASSQNLRLLSDVEGKSTTQTFLAGRRYLTAEHHLRHVPTYWWDRKSEDDSADEPTRSDLVSVSTTSLIVRPIGEIGRLRLTSSLTQLKDPSCLVIWFICLVLDQIKFYQMYSSVLFPNSFFCFSHTGHEQ